MVPPLRCEAQGYRTTPLPTILHALGTHSFRRTKASIIYKATGNLHTVQLLLGHTKIESTVRYLGVDVEDALNLAEHTEV
jgi:integrase